MIDPYRFYQDSEPIIAGMEARGIRVDVAQATQYFQKLNPIYKNIKKIWEARFHTSFVDSGKYLASIWEKNNWRYRVKRSWSKAKRKYIENPDFSKEILPTYDVPPEVIKCIFLLRKNQKKLATLKTFVESGGKVYPKYELTVTGRFRCSSPNIQNLENKDKTGTTTMDCLLPHKGFKRISRFDYSQGEYRMFADYTGNKKLIGELNDGADYHQWVSDKVKVERSRAKTINFGLLYGCKDPTLANLLGGTRQDAALLRRDVLHILGPKAEIFIKLMETQNRVRLWSGAKIKVDSGHKAINYLCQGGLAHCVRLALLRVYKHQFLDRLLLLANIHDENIYEDEGDMPLHLVREIMENCYQSQNGIKMKVSISISKPEGRLSLDKKNFIEYE